MTNVCFLSQMLPLSTNVKEAYRNGRDNEQNFIQNLSLFLCTFLRQHGQLIDKKVELHEVLLEVWKLTDFTRYVSLPQTVFNAVEIMFNAGPRNIT